MADFKKVAGNDQIELYARDEYGKNGRITVMSHAREFIDERARLVSAFVERWGMVAGSPDGEDSAGRQKLKLETPEAVVARAIKMVELMWPAFKQRGWLFGGPPYADYVAALEKDE